MNAVAENIYQHNWNFDVSLKNVTTKSGLKFNIRSTMLCPGLPHKISPENQLTIIFFTRRVTKVINLPL